MSKGRVRTSFDLVCVAAAVLFLGRQLDLEAEASPTRSAPYPSLPLEVLAEVKPGGKYYGLFSNVARRVQRDNSHVCQVAHGHSRSKPIWDELHREIARMDVEPPSPAPIPQALWPEFKRGGRYFGIVSQVVQSCSADNSNVWGAIKGTRKSARVLRAVREEMARRESALAGVAL